MDLTPTMIRATFWHNVEKGTGEGCWIWNWMLDQETGYGTTKLT
jgi:hypothetical protein